MESQDSKTAPYFAFYASDMMADKRYRMMSLSERGLLISLMSECWVNRAIPGDPEALGKWLGYPGAEIKGALTERVLAFFAKDKTDLICPEIEKYRTKILDRRNKQSTGGKKGSNTRWNKDSHEDELPNGLPNDQPNGVLDRKERNGKAKTGLQRGADIPNDLDDWRRDYESHDYDKASNGY